MLRNRSRSGDSAGKPRQDAALQAQSIGALIGGPPHVIPELEPLDMALHLQVTFRPLPADTPFFIQSFVLALTQALRDHGVRVIPWEQALVIAADAQADVSGSHAVKAGRNLIGGAIDAVIDVERGLSIGTRARILLAESYYRWTSRKQAPASITRILNRIAWLDDDLLNQLEDPFQTQIVVIRPLDRQLLDADITYTKKIQLGLKVLFRSFAQIALQVSPDKLSILNLNLCDTVYPLKTLKETVLTSLIPKLYVPIQPILLSRFTLGTFKVDESQYASQLVELSKDLGQTGLFPSGSALAKVIRRRSSRDIFTIMADGRAGVSYGFVAWAEPPQYSLEPVELSAEAWHTLQPVPHITNIDVRQTPTGRWFVRLEEKLRTRYHQIPDLWLVSSCSGADKSRLGLHDIVRVGLSNGRLTMLSAEGGEQVDGLRPSYDLYVMFGLALGLALYFPERIRNGAPLVHFHGYPSPDWFAANELMSGGMNPSMPCGTFESGIFNFLAIAEAAMRSQATPELIAVVEPDHGVNIVAADRASMIRRLNEGVASGQIELGGKFYSRLREASFEEGISSQ